MPDDHVRAERKKADGTFSGGWIPRQIEANAVRRNCWLLVGASSFNEGIMPLAVVDCMELSNEKVFR